jgi:hypothetical protein
MPEINLTKGKIAIVDAIYFEHINSFKWYFSSCGYAARNVKNSFKKSGKDIICMHREIYIISVGTIPNNFVIDHINQNKLDNRLVNLRLATKSQNAINSGKFKTNSSGFKGVSKYKQTNKFRARLTANGTELFLGIFKTAEEAHEAYRAKCQEVFGDYAGC